MVIRGYRFAIVLMRIIILYSYYHNIFQHLSHASRLEEVLDDSDVDVDVNFHVDVSVTRFDKLLVR